MIIEYIPTFKYFSSFTKISSKQIILDFGSNSGNFLKSGPINPKQYTGVDVDIEAIEDGKKHHPDANWVWYNRQNPAYNSTGDGSYPVLDIKFDLVVSYSVFSHTSVEDMYDLLGFLYKHLNDNGSILFSYCDIDSVDCVEWFRNRRVECDEVSGDNFSYLVDNKNTLDIPQSCTHFVTFYKTEWLLDKLKEFNPVSYSPHGGWVQHCMKISK